MCHSLVISFVEIGGVFSSALRVVFFLGMPVILMIIVSSMVSGIFGRLQKANRPEEPFRCKR